MATSGMARQASYAEAHAQYSVRPDRDMSAWLFEGDASIRWQAMADLFHSPPQEVARERARVATEGWGAQILSRQDDDGLWAGALYSPKWTSTTYTLLLLERLGLDPSNTQARKGTEILWNSASDFDGGLNLAKTLHEPETCITGMLVFLASTFSEINGAVDDSVAWLLDQQLRDGGWNCESIRSGSFHGSFHTSITVLEALDRYERSGGTIAVAQSTDMGREFFLAHQLYRSHRTGELVDHSFTRFPFPPQWHFDIMRGLEHFRTAGAAADDRLSAAINSVGLSRRSDGTWPMFGPYAGSQWLKMESRGPSRWSTLRAYRVLGWWESQRRQAVASGHSESRS